MQIALNRDGGEGMTEEKQLTKKTKKRQLDIGLLIVTLILLALGIINGYFHGSGR